MKCKWSILLCLQVYFTGAINADRKKTSYDNVEITGVRRLEYVRCYRQNRQNPKQASPYSCMCISYTHNIRRKCSAWVSYSYDSERQCHNCVRYEGDNDMLKLAVSNGIILQWYSCWAIETENVTVDNFVLVLQLSDIVFKKRYLCTNVFDSGNPVDQNKIQAPTGNIPEKIPNRHKRESVHDDSNDIQVTSEYSTINTAKHVASKVGDITGTKSTVHTPRETTQVMSSTPKVVGESNFTTDTMLASSNPSVITTLPSVIVPSTPAISHISTKQSQISSPSITRVNNGTQTSSTPSLVKTSIMSRNTVRMTTEATKNKTDQDVSGNSTDFITKQEKEKTSIVVIVVAVLVPILIAAIIGIIVYKWYRRKYPVRMVIGKNFSKFENPMYSKKTSTLTLVMSNMSFEDTGEIQNGGHENSSLDVDDSDLQPKSMNERNNLTEIDEVPVKKPRRQRISVMSTESVDRNVMSAFLQEAMDEVDSEGENLETEIKEKKKLSVDEQLRKNVSRISIDSENGSQGDNRIVRKKTNNNVKSSNESSDNSDEEVADEYDLVEVEQDDIQIESVRQSVETDEEDQGEPIVTLKIKLHESERDQYLDNEEENGEIVSDANDNIGIDDESSVSNESYTLEGEEMHYSDQTDSDDDRSLDSLTNKANFQYEQTSIDENLVTTSYQKLDLNSSSTEMDKAITHNNLVVNKEFSSFRDTDMSSDEGSILQTKQFTNENHQDQDPSIDDPQNFVNSDDEYSRISDSEHNGHSSDREFERLEASEILQSEDNEKFEDIIAVFDLPVNVRTDLLPKENDSSFIEDFNESAERNKILFMPGEAESDTQSDPDVPSTPPVPSKPPPTFQNFEQSFSADHFEIINRTNEVHYEIRQSLSSLEFDSNNETGFISGEDPPPSPLPSSTTPSFETLDQQIFSKLPGTKNNNVPSTYFQTSNGNESGNEFEIVLNDDDLICVSPEPDDNSLTSNSDLRDYCGFTNQDNDSGKKRNEVHLHQDTSDTGSDVSSISTGSDSDENSNRGPIGLQQNKHATVADTKVIERPKINFDETDSSDEASINELSEEDDS